MHAFFRGPYNFAIARYAVVMLIALACGNGCSSPPMSLRSTQATLAFPLMPCGDLSVFVIAGLVENIQSDASDPIRLLYSKQYGVIDIGGKGKIFSMRNRALGDVIFPVALKIRPLRWTRSRQRILIAPNSGLTIRTVQYPQRLLLPE